MLSSCVAISDYVGKVAAKKMAWKERAKRVKSSRTKNKMRFPIGVFKYAMKSVKADYMLKCRPLQMEEEKLNAVIVEVGVFRWIQCNTFKSSCCLQFLHLIQFNISL